MPSYKHTRQLLLFGTKICTKCQAEKPATAFYNAPSLLDGYSVWCKACMDAKNRQWFKDHPAYQPARMRRWHASAAGKATMARWNALPEVKARRREQGRLQRQTEKFKIGQRARRKIDAARRKGAPGACSVAQLQARWDFYGGLCWMCGRSATSIDHVKPISKGGSNWPANLRPACGECNSRKGNKWPWPPRQTKEG